MPVKYAGLTQRTLCSPINHRAERRNMENKRRSDRFQWNMKYKHAFSLKRQSLSLFYKLLTTPQTQFSDTICYFMWFGIISRVIFMAFQRKTQTWHLSPTYSGVQRLLLPLTVFIFLVLAHSGKECSSHPKYPPPPFWAVLKAHIAAPITITPYLKQYGDWYTNDLPVSLENNEI